MVAPGNTDKHRRSMSGLKGVQETEKWGRNTARERYGKLDTPDMKAKDYSQPQKLGDSNNLQDPRYNNEVSNSWLRGRNESAEGKPGYNKITPRRS
jgi:hypothetical protein